MNMIFTLSGFARVVPFRGRTHSHDRTQSVTVRGSSAGQGRQSPLRARWLIDPVSGRLLCEWVSDDEVPDSRGSRLDRRVIHVPDRAAVARLAA